MKTSSRMNRKFWVVMLLVAFIFSVAFFAIPKTTSNTASVSFEDTYEDYYNAYMDIMTNYEVASASSVGAEEDRISRLIVNTYKDIDENGAVASCYFDGTYILQYSNLEDADRAYELYQNSGIEVCYDEKITAESSGVFAMSTSYNSWGWNQSKDYCGINAYLNTLRATTDESQYNKVIVAVLDTGINRDHNLFAGRIDTAHAKSYVSDSGTTYNYEDKNGHGTHVSGTIAEATPSAVKILPLKVLNYKGEGYSSGIINAINYARGLQENGSFSDGYQLRVMNMSLGLEAGSSNVLTTPITNAYNAGILSVVAAGNEKQNTSNCQPANISCAITISALKQVQYGTSYLLFDSSYSNFGSSVDFSAPGTSIRSAWIGGSDETKIESGTSMATPHASACVALLYINPKITGTRPATELTGYVYDMLVDNVNKKDLYNSGSYAMGTATKNNYYGYGCINIAGCAIPSVGSVTFSVGNRFQDGAFDLSLGYSEEYTGTLKVYYSTTDGELNSLFPASKHFTDSVRITAMAYVYVGDAVVQCSEITTRTYYVGNMDIEKNYVIDNDGAIKYYGTELTTLNVPNSIGGKQVKKLAKQAFQSSSIVQVVNLPSSVTEIGENAFYGNSHIKTISCESSSVAIGKAAFQKCYALENVNIDNIVSIGDNCFAYDSMLTSMALHKIETIGRNAFTSSGVKDLYLGQNVASIGAHVSPVLIENVYGYAGTAAETFATSCNANFNDLTLRIREDFGTQKVIKKTQTDDLVLTFVVKGFSLTTSNIAVKTLTTSVPNSAKPTITLQEIETNSCYKVLCRFEHAKFTYLNNGTSYTFQIEVTDGFGNQITTAQTRIIVSSASASQYGFNLCEGDYDVIVDGWKIENPAGFVFYSGNNYNIQVVAKDGYKISNVKIGGQNANEDNSKQINNVSENVAIALSSAELETLSVRFVYSTEKGSVVVDEQDVEECFVDRNETITFEVKGKSGYYVKRVLLDGEKLDGLGALYTIENIVKNHEVEIVFEAAYFKISVTYVGSCGSISPSSEVLNKVAYGETKEITITPKAGYKIDFVTIDGNVVKVENGTFKVEEISKDTDVVVSFKQERASILSSAGESVILEYFFVFAALFAIFVIARIILFVVRKNKEKAK